MIAVASVFWACVGLLVYAQAGYGILLWSLAALRRPPRLRPGRLEPGRDATVAGRAPEVSVIVAAHGEQDVIAARVENLRALDYPADALELIVAVDGSDDDTAARARAAGADLVLELPRGGKVLAQDAAVARARGELLAFSDANAEWAPDALARLVEVLAGSARVGYVCGQLVFSGQGGENQEGLYWRYELWLRALESRLASITAGNGAIYAVRRDAYFAIGALAGHDLSFPFGMVKRGLRAVYVPAAIATEKLTPSLDGEFVRKRRMARRTWPTVFAGGLMSVRGYGPLYALMIYSHRVLRYLVPFLHLLALATNLALLGSGWVYVATLALQALVVAAALVAPAVARVPVGGRLALVARYYLVTNAALAIGLWDWLRGDRSPVWETVAGTR